MASCEYGMLSWSESTSPSDQLKNMVKINIAAYMMEKEHEKEQHYMNMPEETNRGYPRT